MAFSNTWDETLPADAEGAKLGAGRIRTFKTDVRERLAIDHSFAEDANDGKHKQTTLMVSASKPTISGTDAAVYSKAVNGISELFYEDSTGAEVQLTSAGAISTWLTGDVVATMRTTAAPGWIVLDDGTIGDASSGGTTRANADTSALFTLLWNNCADAQCTVSTGRGVSAAADFAAHKTISIPKSLGRAIAVAGAGAGLTSRALALAIGEETHQLTTTEMPSHSHSGSTGTESASHTHALDGNILYNVGGSGTVVSSGSTGTNPPNTGTESANHTHNFTTNSNGSDGAHNNMQPSVFMKIHMKL